MQLRRLVSLFFALSVLLTGCYYEPAGDSFTEVPLKDYSSLSVDLAKSVDTLYISELTRIDFKFKDGGYPLVGLEARIGEKQLTLGTSGSSVYVHVQPDEFTPGFYKIGVKLKVKSNTGSLADTFGFEEYHLETFVPVLIDSQAPNKIAIVKLDSADGKMVVHWEKYTRWNFESYQIITECENWNGGFDGCSSVTITDPSITFWEDKNFVGGGVKYRVYVTAAKKMSYGEPFSYKWLPKTSFSIVNGRIVVSWEPPLFYKNAKKAFARTSGTSFSALPNGTTSYNSDNTAALGTKETFLIKLEPADPNRSFTFQVFGYLGKGYESPAKSPNWYNPKVDKYYALSGSNPETLVQDADMNVETFVTYNGRPHIKSLSPNGEYVLTYIFEAPSKHTFYQNDPVTLQLGKEYAIENPTQSPIVQYFQISNNGLVAIKTGGGQRVVDWETGAVIYDRKEYFSELEIAISYDGEFLVVGTDILRFDGSAFSPFGKITGGSPSLSQFTRQGLLINIINGKLQVWNPESATLVREITIPNTSSIVHFAYDTVSDHILVNTSDTNDSHYLINPNSGTVKLIATTEFKVTLLNGKLFAPYDNYGFSSVDLSHFE